MELLLLFLIAAVGGVWWLNYVMSKKAHAEEKAKAEKQEAEAPYKLDIPEEKIVVTPSVQQAMEQTAVQPILPSKVDIEEKPVKKPRKTAASKKPATSKARTKKPVSAKPVAKKIKK